MQLLAKSDSGITEVREQMLMTILLVLLVFISCQIILLIIDHGSQALHANVLRDFQIFLQLLSEMNSDLCLFLCFIGSVCNCSIPSGWFCRWKEG